MFNCERYIISTLESKYTQFADTMREIRMASGKKSRVKELEEEQSGERENEKREELRRRDLWQPVAQLRSLVRPGVSTGA